MIHTYRDSDVLENATRGARAAPYVILVSLVFLATGFIAYKTASTGAGWTAAFAGIALFFGLGHWAYTSHQRTRCREIRLFDDAGVCEIETEGGVIRLHVNQIRSVKYERDGDSLAAYYIRHQDGSVPVNSQMQDFADFLVRLKRLNPNVDLSSFPSKSKTWAGVDTSIPPGQGTRLGRGLRAALFPVVVAAALVWLALEALKPG